MDRTTVTLDPDVKEQLKAVARKRNVSFKVALNDTVRAGLAEGRGGRRRFVVDARPMGVKPGVNLTKALQLAADLEDEEIMRKLELRK
jgi:predicted transcriptional regulator